LYVLLCFWHSCDKASLSRLFALLRKAPTLTGAYNRAYLASVLRTSPKSAFGGLQIRSERYAKSNFHLKNRKELGAVLRTYSLPTVEILIKTIILSPPLSYNKVLGNLPKNVIVMNELKGTLDLIHFFTKKREELETMFPRLKQDLSQKDMLWISWPESSANIETDLKMKPGQP